MDDYDPASSVTGSVEPAELRHCEIATSNEDVMAFTRLGHVRFEAAGVPSSREVYWLEGYSDGLFVPFAEPISGDETYGAGRYLLDTIKGADLGHEDGQRRLDFNFAYQPSCAYDPRRTCRRAPPALGARAGRRALRAGTVARHCRRADQARRSPQPLDADPDRTRGSGGAAAGEEDAIVTGSTPRSGAVDQGIHA